MAETITLDPTEVATARTQVVLTPWISEEGVDWGDAAIVAYMAEQARGSTPVDFKVPNRTVTIPLTVKAVGGTTFATARTTIQAKAAMFQREGGWLKRITASGGTVYADIVNATLKLSGGWLQSHRSADIDAQLVLETTPDFYGAEVTLADHVETSAAEIVFTETGVLGDYPGRVRIVVDEDEGQLQQGLLWSIRQRHYSAASTAATRYEAEALTPLDTATRAALTGASGGTVVTHGTVSTNWTPVLSTNLQAGTFLTHTGTNRLFARYRTSGTAAVQLRAVYDAGDLASPVENTPITTQATGVSGTAFYIADLGELRLDAGPVGTHRWQGHIQAKGAVGSEDISLDKLWVLNVDDGFGKLSVPVATPVEGSVGLSARDTFDHTAGNLAGKTAPVGGVWAGSGDAVDFTLETTNHYAQRTELNDVTNVGRMAVVPVSLTNVAVRADFMWSAAVASSAIRSGVVARYSGGGTSYVRCFFQPITATTARFEVNSVSFVLARVEVPLPPAIYASGTWYSILFVVYTNGTFAAWFGDRDALPTVPQIVGYSVDLATGGSMATGSVGLYDEMASAAPARTRYYDNLVAWVPSQDAVAFASRTVQIATDGAHRLDSTGTAYGPVASPGGVLPRLPPAGLEARTTEVFVKMSRGDLDMVPDTGIDNLSARVYYRPSWLFVS